MISLPTELPHMVPQKLMHRNEGTANTPSNGPASSRKLVGFPCVELRLEHKFSTFILDNFWSRDQVERDILKGPPTTYLLRHAVFIFLNRDPRIKLKIIEKLNVKIKTEF